MYTFIFLLALIIFGSLLAFIIGLVKVITQKEDKEFGLNLIIYSLIAFIIGFGSCVAVLNY